MVGFNKETVLETILKEVPVLSNLKKEIGVRGKKINIYAYYWNRGVPDSELKYDKEKNPIKTTPESSLCEIYSGWRNKPGENSGPLLDYDSLNTSEDVRKGMRLIFGHAPIYFAEHFNKISKKLGYELKFCLERESNGIVEILRDAQLISNDRIIGGQLLIERQIGLSLSHHDSSLSNVLDLIEKAYEDAKKNYREDREVVFIRN